MSSKKIIGPASEFFRLRVTRVDEPEETTLDWRDDILYRTPPQDIASIDLAYLVEAVDIREDGVAHCIARFDSGAEANDALIGIQEDLEEMTLSTFVERYKIGQ